MVAQDRDYYDVLGVPRDADEHAIKNAYHKLAMEWHPDRNSTPEAEEKFKEIAKAYAILKDPKKRARYDSQGMEGVAHFTPDDLYGGLDLGDLFGDMGFGFGGGSIFDRMFSGRRRANQPAHGQDLRISIEVSLDVIFHGGKQEIHVSHPMSCDVCHGYGTQDGKPAPLCQSCKGSGRKVQARDENKAGQQVRFQQITICPDCHGKGVQIKTPCLACSGYGKVEKEETLKIAIPPGINDGMVLRIAGHGLPAEQPGLPAGDLHVSVFSQPDPRFQRQGADLWRSETIDVIDAVLGTEIQVPTMDGQVKVKIPAGSQADEILRLKGKGLPYFQKNTYGDFNLRIKVHVPEKLTDEEHSLYSLLKEKRS